MTDNKLQKPIMDLANAVCEAYGLELLSFDEMEADLYHKVEYELSAFFGGLAKLWKQAEDDNKLWDEDVTHCKNCSTTINHDHCPSCNGTSRPNYCFGIHPDAELEVKNGCLSINNRNAVVEFPSTEFVKDVIQKDNQRLLRYISESEGVKEIPLSDVFVYWA